MSSRRDRLPSHVEDTLRCFDFHVVPSKLHQRNSFMVQCHWEEGHDTEMTAKFWSPEGLDMQHFWDDCLTMPEDHAMDYSCRIMWRGSQKLPDQMQRIWIFNAMYTIQDGSECLIMDDESSWIEVPGQSRDTPLTVVELFAGGFGGWSMAWSVLNQMMKEKVNVLAVDDNLSACRTYAITHEAAFIPEGGEICKQDFERKSNRIIWQADVAEQKTIETIASMNADLITVSAPCPAWSGAAGAEGLHKEEGELMLKSLLQCRVWRPKIIAVEQVSNFNFHEHKACIMKAIQYMGYRLIGQRVLNLDKHCQTSRCRWLAIIARVVETDLIPLVPWPAPKEGRPIPTMQLAEEDLHLMVMDAKTKEVASNPKMSKGAKGLQPAQVLKSRMYSEQETIPCFMAQYGNQHNLPQSKQYGYLGHFLSTKADKTEGRMWRPAEIAALHGVIGQYWVDADLPTSWRLVGNCIGTPHALFLLCNSLTHFDEQVDIGQAFDKYHEMKLKPRLAELINTTQGQLMKPLDLPTNGELMNRAVELYFPHEDELEWWDPKKGWNRVVNPTTMQEPPTTLRDSSEGELPTAPMFGHYEGFLCFGSTKQQFWFSTDLKTDQIESHWQGAYWDLTKGPVVSGLTLREQPYGPDQIIAPTDSVPVMTAHDMTLIKIDYARPYSQQPQLNEYGQLFDQYGPIQQYQTPKVDDVLSTVPWNHNRPGKKIVEITKAMMNTQTTWHWNPNEDCPYLQVAGDKSETKIVLEFWSQLLTQETLNIMGRTVQMVSNRVHFHALSTKVACPNRPFRLGIAVQAAKALFDICRFRDTSETYPVKLRMFGKHLWEGNLPANLSIDVVKIILKLAMKICTHGVDYRIIVEARQIYDSTIESLFKEGKHKLTLHAVNSQRGGGGESHKGAKHQQKQQIQSALATVMLEQGYPLDWTKDAIEQIVWKCGLSRLQTITGQPRGPAKVQSILEICKEIGIQQPEMPRPQSQKQQPGMPWQGNKKKREMQTMVDVRDYQVVDNFFFNSDDSPIDIIQTIKPQTSGLCLLSGAEAQQWIMSDQLLSSDELAIVAVGSVHPHDKLKSTSVTFPAVSTDGQTVLLHGTMIQLGAKEAKHKVGNPSQIASEKCTVVSITMSKDDWSEEDWLSITSNPAAVIRRVLKEDQLETAIQSLWGKSLRNGKAPCSPKQALSCQMHCTIMEDKIRPFLSKSGFNKLYCVPKTQQGKVQPDFRIIWCEGDLPAVTGLSSRTPHALGLVRNRQGRGFGIRVPRTAFEEAWKAMYPGLTPPELREGELTYKIENLQFGSTKTMLDQWLQQLKWKAVAIKSLGPQSWIVKSDHAPPEGIHTFNAAPVLIRQMQDKNQRPERILLGPRPKGSGKGGDPWQGGGLDPWAGFTPTTRPQQAAPSQVHVSRASVGPVETRFQEQEARITAIQQNLDKLAQNQQSSHAEVQHNMARLEQQQTLQATQMQSAFKQLQSEIDKNLSNTLQQHAKVADTQFQELKRMFMDSQKRKTPAEGDEPM
eukprot:Skav200190  [mRNA]  locus=scaffold2383:195121:199644:+ [translate_table: standard]